MMEQSSEQPLLLGMAAMTAAVEAHAASLANFQIVPPIEACLSSSSTSGPMSSARFAPYDLPEQHQQHQPQQNQQSQAQDSQYHQEEQSRYRKQQAGKSSTDGKHRRCQAPGCETQCNFGFPGSRATYCFSHKLEGQVNVNHRSCESPECRRLATFASPGDKPRLCGAHKQPGMKSRHKRPNCELAGCSRQPVFGYPGQPRRSCAAHRAPGMESKTAGRICRGRVSGKGGRDVSTRCAKRARFNFDEPGSKPIFCQEHRVAGMVCLKAGTCEAEGCSKRASFSFEQDGATTLCATHRQPGMVQRKRPGTCEVEGCSRLAAPATKNNDAGDGAASGMSSEEELEEERERRGKRRRCRQHSLAEAPEKKQARERCHRRRPGAEAATTRMTASSSRPGSPSCPSTPPRPPPQAYPASFQPLPDAGQVASLQPSPARRRSGRTAGALSSAASAGTAVSEAAMSPTVGGSPGLCVLHAVAAPTAGGGGGDDRCEHPGCWRDPVFAGYAGPSERWPRFCPPHRMDALVDVSNSRCREDGCEIIASWGYTGGQALRCGYHRHVQMVDVKARRCWRGGCSRLPYFAAVAAAGEGAAWCSAHKTEGMVDVRSQRCAEEGCINLPLDTGRGEEPSNLCREHHRTAWAPASEETGFPSPITDADTAEAATVVAGLWADAIGGDWDLAGGSSSTPASNAGEPGPDSDSGSGSGGEGSSGSREGGGAEGSGGGVTDRGYSGWGGKTGANTGPGSKRDY